MLPTIRPSAYENGPDLFVPQIRPPAVDTHKYARGHVAVFSGGAAATGAARLASLAAQRAGAGAVTLLSPPDALLVNAAHLTSIILRRCAGQDEALRFLAERKPGALVLGPGFGIGEETAGLALALIAAAGGIAKGLVFDADAITSLAGERAAFLFEAQRKPGRAALVLTPHEGEFGRLFPNLAGEGSKLDRAREAAARAGAVLIYKGPDTVIAAPDGRAAINGNGTAWLATAGSGDVLCGIVACPAGARHAGVRGSGCRGMDPRRGRSALRRRADRRGLACRIGRGDGGAFRPGRSSGRPGWRGLDPFHQRHGPVRRPRLALVDEVDEDVARLHGLILGRTDHRQVGRELAGGPG